MKLNFYLLLIGSILATSVFGQVQTIDDRAVRIQPSLTVKETPNTKVRGVNNQKGGEPEIVIHWSEDFSNGLDGFGDNGAWTTEGDQGNLWFQAFPPMTPNGYSSNELVPGYGDVYPNFNTGLDDDIIPFTTADNGFMMFDADRANSILTDPNLDDVSFITTNLLDAQLISPPIDLTGVDNALLTFWERWRICCFAFSEAINIDFSTDGGISWVAFSLNDLTPDLVVQGAGGPSIEAEPAIDISAILQNANDLTDCRVRVRWNPASQANQDGDLIVASHYYVMIDDINIIGLPENDLVAGETFFNNYWVSDSPDLGVDYVSSFENFAQPEYSTRPFNFAAVVTNEGTQEQTGVNLTVRAFLNGEPVDPDGDTDEWVSEVGLTLQTGESDTIFINDVAPEWWISDESNPAAGTYTFEFEFNQNEEEFRPSDNFGLNRSTIITTDGGNEGQAIMQNDRNNLDIFYPTLGDDVIWGSRYTFDEIDAVEDIVITHVEFALSGNAGAPSQEGEEIFINVATGNVFDVQDDVDAVDRFYDEDELSYIILEEDLTEFNPLNWISYELPEPILVSPGEIYQAEIHVPNIGFDGVIPCVSEGQEIGATVVWDWQAMTLQWLGIGITDAEPHIGGGICLRFRTADSGTLNTTEITYESGIKLTQNYPNPVVDNTMIQFQLDEASPVTFEVFDITGKMVYQEDMGNVARLEARVFDFDASALSAGTYTYSVVTENERVSRKMTVTK